MMQKSSTFHLRFYSPLGRQSVWRYRFLSSRTKRRLSTTLSKTTKRVFKDLCSSSHAVKSIGHGTANQRNLTELPKTVILVGDIGGTNARLSLWNLDRGEYSRIFEKWYPTSDFREEGFEAVLKELCKNENVIQNYPSTACFAIAGPVAQNKARMTNLGWIIDAEHLEKTFKWKVSLVNDFEALGYGIPLLSSSDLVVLNDVPSQEKAPIAVLGPGTGLGQAQLMWDEGKGGYKVWPSEGAHSDFAPRDEKQRDLQRWVTEGYGYCELEHVACGSGLERIYTFLQSEGKASVTEPPLLTAPEISKRALSGEDSKASEALDMMLSIIGAEAGHMGLRGLTHGGIFIAGGITPKVIERVKSDVVLNAFLHEESHRFRPLLKSFRLCAVLNEEVGLIGCRHQATQLLYL